MPERPDLEYVVPILADELRGRTITGVRVKKPVVLRVAMRGAVGDLVTGRRIELVVRRGHFVRFELDGKTPLELAVAPMLAGRFSVDDAKSRSPKDLAVGFGLDDGRELRYRDDVQMGKVFVIERGDWKQVPGLAQMGVDVLDEDAFTVETFFALAKRRRDQVKVFLMDKSALDSMGNAYADEVLFEAGIHPKAMVRALSKDQLSSLRTAIVTVLSHARDEIRRRKPATHEKIRDFLKVRGRAGEPCVHCGGKLRRAGVRGHDAIFCPRCQPDARSSGIVDWSKVTRSAGAEPSGAGPSGSGSSESGSSEPAGRAPPSESSPAARPARKAPRGGRRRRGA